MLVSYHSAPFPDFLHARVMENTPLPRRTFLMKSRDPAGSAISKKVKEPHLLWEAHTGMGREVVSLITPSIIVVVITT